MEKFETILKMCAEQGISCIPQAPMKEYTSFHIGGPATVLVKPKCVEEICWIRRNVEKLAKVWFVGKGSNLLIPDEGLEGVVVVLGPEFSDVRVDRDGFTLVCEAGAPLMKACREALEHGLTGLEFAWGIPGSVGGGAYMNAGAYGGELKDVIAWCEHVDQKGNLCRVEGNALDFSYRHSFYTGKNLCIIRVGFRLEKGDPQQIRARMDELMTRRKEKQPLEFPSAGSTFKRPEGAYAAALIEQCGLKGVRVGDAMVSEKHSGFLINVGNATCADVQELIRQVQEKVWQKTGFRLECEVGTLK